MDQEYILLFKPIKPPDWHMFEMAPRPMDPPKFPRGKAE